MDEEKKQKPWTLILGYIAYLEALSFYFILFLPALFGGPSYYKRNLDVQPGGSKELVDCDLVIIVLSTLFIPVVDDCLESRRYMSESERRKVALAIISPHH